MRIINTTTDANQEIDYQVENDTYKLNLRSSLDGEIIYFSIIRNSETIIQNQLAMPNESILLNKYQFQDHGNFIFLTSDGIFPNTSDLGSTIFLHYLTKSEVSNV